MLPDYEWLDTESRRMLDSHSDDCPACRQLKQLVLGEDNSPWIMLSPPTDLSAGIMGRIKAQTAAPLPNKQCNITLPAMLAVMQMAAILIFSSETVAKGADLLLDALYAAAAMLSGFAAETLTLAEMELSALPELSSAPDISSALVASILFTIATMLFIKAREFFRT